MESEKRRFFVSMATSAYHVLLKEAENCIFRHSRIFRHTCMYKQSILTSSGVTSILWEYYIVTSDTPIDAWMCFSDCSL